MKFNEYHRYDAVGLAELIRKKEVSADEVLQAALNRLDEVNPKLNLLAHDLRERAAAWQGSSENADTPLAGVPFLLKDLLADWEGAPTWSGSRMMQHYIAKQNSDLTQAYLDAGLRVFGKTTTPEWGAYPVTETEIYGITRNPWHLDYTAGGSGFGRRTRSARQRRRRLHPLTRAQLRRVRAETHARPQQLRAERIGGMARFGMRPCLDPQRTRQRGFAGHRRPNPSPRPVCLPAAARKRFCRQPETRNGSSENRFLEADMVWRRQRRRHGSRVRP